MSLDTYAFVGAAGGVGTTRLTLETATLLAGEGHDVAVLDAAYATQGLADLTSGRLDPDVTALCLDDTPLEQGLVDRDVDGAGRLAVCPARAPFERLARAKSPAAAEAFERRVGEAARAFDHVLVDTPPVAANQAVSAVTAVDGIALVCDAPRAEAAVPRMIDRLSDVGVEPSVTVVTRTDDHPDADVTVPEFDVVPPAVEADDAAVEAVAAVLEETLGVKIEREERGWLRSRLRP